MQQYLFKPQSGKKAAIQRKAKRGRGLEDFRQSTLLQLQGDGSAVNDDEAQLPKQQVVQLNQRPRRSRRIANQNTAITMPYYIRNKALREKAAKEARKEEAMRRELRKQGHLLRAIQDYKGYPPGSYGHGRYLYLRGKLPVLAGPLISYIHAGVEIDHSPHDGSQRAGNRVDDEASRYRVAVPLPRAWHRRHKTTHGPVATRYDPNFVEEQNDRVSDGNYAEALKEHLLDTFSDDAMGNSSVPQVQGVIKYTKTAINYAASNIPVKLHEHHEADQPLIDDAQKDEILQALGNRINQLKHDNPKFANLENQFRE